MTSEVRWTPSHEVVASPDVCVAEKQEASVEEMEMEEEEEEEDLQPTEPQSPQEEQTAEDTGEGQEEDQESSTSPSGTREFGGQRSALVAEQTM